MRALAADPRDPRRIYLGTADGLLYRSDDAGVRWQRLTPGFPQRGKSLDDIVVDPRGVVLDRATGRSTATGGGVARSADGGKTFTSCPGIAGQAVRALAMAPSDPDMMVAGTHHRRLPLPRRRAAPGGASRPEGHPDLRNVDSVAIDPRDPRSSTRAPGTCPGRPWTAAAPGSQVNAGMIDDSDVMTLTVDRWNPQVVYATACSGIYRSQDGGGPLDARSTASRRAAGAPAPSPRAPTTSNGLFAGTTEGLWTSRGRRRRPGALPPQKELVVNAIVALPGGTILLGTDGAGVVRSDGRRHRPGSPPTRASPSASCRACSSTGPGDACWPASGATAATAACSRPPVPRGPWTRLGSGLEGREVLSLALSGSEVAGRHRRRRVPLRRGARWARLPDRGGPASTSSARERPGRALRQPGSWPRRPGPAADAWTAGRTWQRAGAGPGRAGQRPGASRPAT